MKKFLKRGLAWVRPLSGKRVVGLAFIMFILVIAGAALPQASESVHEAVRASSALPETRDALDASYRSMLSFTAPSVLNRGSYINFNGLMASLLGQRRLNARVKLDNGHLLELTEQKDISLPSERITELYEKQREAEKAFLFVLAPSQAPKYEQIIPTGYADYSNENADHLVASLRERGVPVLDLRDAMHEAGISNADAFFASDHHWRPETGFWAHARIVSELTARGMIPAVEPLYTDIGNYDKEVYRELFLGSSGKRTGRFYVNPDDFTVITPRFDSFIATDVPSHGVHREGPFTESVLDWSQIASKNYFVQNAHSMYGCRGPDFASYRNQNAPIQQKVMWIGDSFNSAVVPFTSLVFSSVDDLDMRKYADDFAAYYDRYQPDIVLLMINAAYVNDGNVTYNFFPDQGAETDLHLTFGGDDD